METKTNIFSILLLIGVVITAGLVTYQVTKKDQSSFKAETADTYNRKEILTDDTSGLSQDQITNSPDVSDLGPIPE